MTPFSSVDESACSLCCVVVGGHKQSSECFLSATSPESGPTAWNTFLSQWRMHHLLTLLNTYHFDLFTPNWCISLFFACFCFWNSVMSSGRCSLYARNLINDMQHNTVVLTINGHIRSMNKANNHSTQNIWKLQPSIQRRALPARGIADTLRFLSDSTHLGRWCILAVLTTHFIRITAQQWTKQLNTYVVLQKLDTTTATRLKQGIHRHQTQPPDRNASSGSRLKVQPSTHCHMAHYRQTWCYP